MASGLQAAGGRSVVLGREDEGQPGDPVWSQECSPSLLLDLLTWGAVMLLGPAEPVQDRAPQMLWGHFHRVGGKEGCHCLSVIPHIVFYQGGIQAPRLCSGLCRGRPRSVLRGSLWGCI